MFAMRLEAAFGTGDGRARYVLRVWLAADFARIKGGGIPWCPRLCV